MSRRTRLKSLPRERFTLNHHFSYGASTSYFPRSYSMIGRDIKFPTQITPICFNSKLCFVGTVSQFFQKIKLTNIDWDSLKEVSLSFSGDKYKDSSPCFNFFCFSLSVCFFCFSYIPKTAIYRNKLYPKYKFDDYEALAKIIRMFSKVETLIINFQDNDLTAFKAMQLEEALEKSTIKRAVLRNLTYFMEQEGVRDLFEKIRGKKGMRFAFVWQQLILQSPKECFNEEEQRLINLH